MDHNYIHKLQHSIRTNNTNIVDWFKNILDERSLRQTKVIKTHLDLYNNTIMLLRSLSPLPIQHWRHAEIIEFKRSINVAYDISTLGCIQTLRMPPPAWARYLP